MSDSKQKTVKSATPAPSVKKLSFMALVMINVSAVLSLRGLPAQAEEGYSIIFYLIVGAILFFIPSALVSAELASGWQDEGGVYLWVKEAFGPKWGFTAIFMQWIQNIPWFPSVLTFIGTAIAYVINPKLADNKIFMFVLIVGLLWLLTFVNMFGAKWTAFLSNTGAPLGVLFPGALIMILAVVYIASGQKLAIDFHPSALIPDLSNPSKLLMLVSMLVGLSGIEMSSVHVTEAENPKKNFPKAIIVSTILIIIVNILATLAVALIVPQDQISASAGIYETFEIALGVLNLKWAAPIIFILIAYGSLASVANWLVGPSKGVLIAAKDGYLPKSMQKINEHGVPKNILLIQAAFATVLSLSIFFTKQIQDSFLLMGSLTALLYMTMYLLMFASAIRLRYVKPDVPRSYKIPFGNVGIWVLGVLGIIACLATMVCGFLPPSDVTGVGAVVGYYAFIIIGFVVMVSIPFVLYARSQKNK